MGKKMAVRIAAVVIIFYAILLIPIIVIAGRSDRDSRQKSQMLSASVYAGLLIDTLEQRMNLNDIHAEGLPDTEQAAILEETLLPYQTEEDGITHSFSMEMVYDNGAEPPFLLWSSEAPYKSALQDRYHTDLIEAITLARGQQTVQTAVINRLEVQQGYLVIPADREENDIFYIAGVMRETQTMQAGRIGNDSRCIIVIYSAVLVILTCIIIYRMLRPIHKLTGAMEKVSAGNYELSNTKFPNNELGDMWISLHQMCQALRTQCDTRANVMNYYYRFAPKRFEQLFGKKSIQDVNAGDTVSITATIGIVSVPWKAAAQNLIPEQQVRSVNPLLDIICDENRRKGGILLTNDSKLESVKVIYPEKEHSVDAAVQFGIDSIHALEAKNAGGGSIHPFVMLYTGQFTCGLAGTAEQVYPFATSASLERFSTYLDDLKNIGVRMVLIGENSRHLHNGHLLRDIGCLPSVEGKEDVRVYEVLDAGSKGDRQGKQAAREQFQRALQLYYENDFYLARNCFKEVLKEYAEDGVAKWYLFLCEDMLNAAVSENIRHDLFPQGEHDN